MRRLLAELGFDVNAMERISALHEAASAGDLPMVDLLLSLDADPNLKDCSFNATSLGWAEHGHHLKVIARLTPITVQATAAIRLCRRGLMIRGSAIRPNPRAQSGQVSFRFERDDA